MKTIVGIGVCFFSLLGLAAAQTATTITFNLPNAAVVGTSNLPAGNYTVRAYEFNSGATVLDFMGPNGKSQNVLATSTSVEPDTAGSEVVLKSDGNHLRLEKILIDGRSFSFQLVK